MSRHYRRVNSFQAVDVYPNSRFFPPFTQIQLANLTAVCSGPWRGHGWRALRLLFVDWVECAGGFTRDFKKGPQELQPLDGIVQFEAVLLMTWRQRQDFRESAGYPARIVQVTLNE